MKIKIYSIVLMLILMIATRNLIAQNRIAFYDAKLLSERVSNGEKIPLKYINIINILRYYVGSDPNIDLEKEILMNPFLKEYFSGGGTASTSEKAMNIGIESYFSPIGNLDVTNISQGISLFLIARTKQELNIAFFQRFKDFITKYPEIGILYPSTTNELGNLLAYQYSQMLPVLQSAFYKDMENLPEHLIEVLTLEKYYNQIKDFPEFLVVLKSITLLQQINQLNPPQIVDSLPKIADFKKFPKLEDLHSSFNLTKFLSDAIRTSTADYMNSKKNYWISSKELYDNILNNQVTLNIFLGLIYQQIKSENIVFNGVSLANTIKNDKEKIWWFKMEFSKLLIQVNNINNAAKRIDQLKNDNSSLTNQDIYTYINTTIDLFDFGYDFAAHFNSKLKTEKVDQYIEIARNASGLYINAINKKYALAMNNTIYILNAIRPNISKKDSIYKKSLFNGKAIEGITTYGTFMANMADADTPQRVQAAIEAAALPVGSSVFKKNFRNNITLNAYLGVNGGNWPKNNTSSLTWNNNFRITAPIGIAWTPFSWGKNGALSFFGSILDVGAVVDYQLKTDQSGKELNQKIYLANILSPGVYLIYGLPWNLPVSIGFGGQFGPGLVKIGDNLISPSWKWNFFIGVDIPIFNLNRGSGIIKKG